MLLAMEAARWAGVAIAAVLVAGCVDYFLRLPGALRLAIGVAAVGAFLFLAGRGLVRLLRTRPSLTSLALRLERLQPDLADRLASAVDFTTTPPDRGRPLADRMVDQVTREAAAKLSDEEMRRLLRPRRLGWALLAFGVSLVAATGLAAAAPQGAATLAMKRWAMPLSDAAWPNRTKVVSEVETKRAPTDEPLQLRARVVKGDHAELRAWAVYRYRGEEMDPSGWQRRLMARQTNGDGRFQRSLEPDPDAEKVEVYFQAGDDRTRPQHVDLFKRPELTGLVAEVEPPPYAEGLVGPAEHELLREGQAEPSVEALAGSRVSLRLAVRGAFQTPEDATTDRARQWVQKTFPVTVRGEEATGAKEGVSRTLSYRDLPDRSGAERFRVGFTLRTAVTLGFHPADPYGNRHPDPRRFRFETREDRPPKVSIVEPPADKAVLRKATVPLAAEGEDDVALAGLRLQVGLPDDERRVLAEETPESPQGRLETELEIASLGLEPGQELSVRARAQDNFRLAGKTHDPVLSNPRRIRIISRSELVKKLRTGLAAVRQRAARAETKQKALIEAEPSQKTSNRQRELAGRVRDMKATVEEIRARAERNGLEDKALEKLLGEAKALSEEAEQAAEKAASELEKAASEGEDPATERARKRQEQARRTLEDLTSLLDQGRSVYQMTRKLKALEKAQKALRKKTQKTLPETIGRSKRQLSDQQVEKLKKLAKRQSQLKKKADRAVETLQSTASALREQSDQAADEASAEAMKRASSAALREGLSEKMDSASGDLRENRLSEAAKRQEASAKVMEEMLRELRKREKLKQRILSRRKEKLVRAIRQLVDQQTAQLERLRRAEDVAGLAEPVIKLRRETVAVAEQARRAGKKARPIAEKLDDAAARQQAAAKALRADSPDREAAESAEAASVKRLKEALKLAKQQARAQNKAETRARRKKLMKKYRAILEDEQAIRKATKKLGGEEEDDRGRRWRASVAETAKRQKDVRQALKKLPKEFKQLRERSTYRSMHERMDKWAGEVAKRLQRGEPDTAAVFKESLIIDTVRSILASLKAPQERAEFAGRRGGGGGQGGGGQNRSLIPNMSELLLLRARQKQLRSMTEELANRSNVPETLLRELAGQQRNLASLAEGLRDRLQRSTPPGGNGGQ